MHCKACGAMSRGTYDFCPKCGAYLKDQSQTGLRVPTQPPQQKTDTPAANKPISSASLPKPAGAVTPQTLPAQTPTVNPSPETTPPTPIAAPSSAAQSQPTLPIVKKTKNGQAPSKPQLPVAANQATTSQPRLTTPAARTSGSSLKLPAKRPVATLNQPRQQIIFRPINTPRSWREDPFWLYASMIIFMALWLVAIVVGFGTAGVYQGLQDRTRADIALASEYKQKGKEYVVQGNMELAIAALTEARKRNPKDAEVAQLLASLEAQRAAEPTPTPAPPPDVVKEAENVPSEPAQPAVSLAEARQWYQTKDYENAIVALETLRLLDKTNQKEIEEMLFNAYVSLARVYLGEERWEEAIQKFDRALSIRKSNDLELERYLTALYLRGISSWSADWKRATEAFAEIVRINSEYRDAFNRLYQARVAYGDQLMERSNAPCLAELQYAAALALSNTVMAQAKLEQAKVACAANPVVVTGTPIPPVGNAPPPRPTTPTPSAPAGAKYIVVINSNIQATGDVEASIYGRVLDRSGKPIADLQMKVVNKQGNYERIETTSPEGYYSFNGLAPGDYTVQVVSDPLSVSPSLYAGSKQRVFVNFTAR